MCRTVKKIALLALLAAAATSGALAETARTHGKAASAHPAAHARTTHTRTEARRTAARAHTSHTARPTRRASAARPSTHVRAGERTPEEVGREAGLKIRRELARKREARLRARTHRRVSPAPAVRRQPPTAPELASKRSETAASLKAANEESSRPEISRSVAEKPERAALRAREIPEPLAASTPESIRRRTLWLRPEEASLHLSRSRMPAPLRGSFASLQRQNEKLEAEGLERIQDEDDLSARIAEKLLVPIPVSSALTVNADLAPHHRYCRPWTAVFLADLARAHAAAFHRPLEVSSAVRTAAYQAHLERINGNAAPAEGDIVSPHLMGATIDIAKHGLSRAELAWMRRHLLILQEAGKIDVEEEFQQACFHITVYKDYVPPRRTVQAHAHTAAHSPAAAPAPQPAVDDQDGEGI